MFRHDDTQARKPGELGVTSVLQKMLVTEDDARDVKAHVQSRWRVVALRCKP